MREPDWTDPDPVALDFETRSAADLPKVGGRAYAAHKTTQVLSLVAYVGGAYHVWVPNHIGLNPRSVKGWDVLWHPDYGPRGTVVLHVGGDLPKPVLKAANGGKTFLAHNAYGFDRFVWEHTLKLPPVPWVDTAPLARAAGMRAGLDDLARGCGFGRKYDTAGILKKLSRADVIKRKVVYPRPGPGDLEVLLRYNVGDVVLLRKAWDHFAEFEWGPHLDFFAAHTAVNDRGVGIDKELMRAIHDCAVEAASQAGRELARLTGGQINAQNFRSTQKMHEWLAGHGVAIYAPESPVKKLTLRKDVLEQVLANPWMMVEADTPEVAVRASKNIPPEVFTALRVRASAVRITGGKLANALNRVDRDGRVRDIAIFQGAHTGRSTSTGINLYNLPRGKKGTDANAFLEKFDKGKWPADPRSAYRSIRRVLDKEEDSAKLVVDDVLSTLIRPCLRAGKGGVLFKLDFSQIECRGVNWWAGEERVLEAYRNGRDLYCESASLLAGRTIDPKGKKKAGDLKGAEEDGAWRQLAKVIELASGYGMGADRFRIYCGLNNVDLDAVGLTADQCITFYRSTHPKIAGMPAGNIDGRPYFRGGLWDQVESAAKVAVTNGPASLRSVCGKVNFEKAGPDVHMVLPSGRRFVYRGMRIEDRVPSFMYKPTYQGEVRKRPTLVFDSPRGPTTTYGGRLTENCLGSSTLVLTERGYLSIVDVVPGDRVWDGEGWVPTAGCVYRGRREVGTWLGVRVTADHLTTDGMRWKPVIRSAGPFTRAALKWARGSVLSESFKAVWGSRPVPGACATAGRNVLSANGGCYVPGLATVGRVDTNGVGSSDRPRWLMRTSCRTPSYAGSGCGGSASSFPDAGTRTVGRTATTGGGGSTSINLGSKTPGVFCVTPSDSKVGTTLPRNSTARTTTGGTCPETFGWRLVKSSPEISERTGGWSTGAGDTFSPSSPRSSPPNGLGTPPITTTNGGGQPIGSWATTGRREDVFDLLDSGPRHRFTVLTDHGPVVVHNCVQAFSNDILREAIVNLEREGFPVVLHVYDEVVSEKRWPRGKVDLGWAQDELNRMAKVVTRRPAWAGGFPVGCEGHAAVRYVKEPLDGWPKVEVK